MASSYPVHDDYKKVPSMSLRFNAPMMWVMNSILRFSRWRARGNLSSDVTRETLTMESEGGGRFDVISVRPKALDPASAAPALVYFHGGAFAMSWSSMHLEFCERYAQEAGCHVFLVAYRLMPANPFPAGFDDCYQAVMWVRENAETLGVDTQRIVVGGDSAGGAMAAGVAQKALDNGITLRGQLLIYPVTDNRSSTRSATEFIDTPLWNGVSNKRMWECYLKNSGGEVPPYAAPGLREKLIGLPRAYVETAEFDPLRDEGLAYAKALADQDVAVEVRETKGTIHGYEMAAENPETIASLKRRVDFLRACFAED